MVRLRIIREPVQSVNMNLFSRLRKILAILLSWAFSSPLHRGKQWTVNMPYKFPKTMSVKSRSPTIQISEGSVTSSPKCDMSSVNPPGFFSWWRTTGIPSEDSIRMASSNPRSSAVPAELLKIATLDGPKIVSAFCRPSAAFGCVSNAYGAVRVLSLSNTTAFIPQYSLRAV